MMQHILHSLQHGYTYDKLNDDGSVSPVQVPPNRYMIFAAKEIIKLVGHLETVSVALETERARSAELDADCVKYRETIKRLTNDSSNSTH